MNPNLIYGLYCPFTNNLHYVGKSKTYMIRPLQHMKKSHPEKINEWVSQLKILGHKLIIKVLEECTEDNLDQKEEEWIKKSLDEGCYLLNVAHNHVDKILAQKQYKFEDTDILTIAKIIKEARQNLNFRQEDLCEMAGISRPTLIMIEKGNNKTIFYNLKKVLSILGFEIIIRKKSI